MTSPASSVATPDVSVAATKPRVPQPPLLVAEPAPAVTDGEGQDIALALSESAASAGLVATRAHLLALSSDEQVGLLGKTIGMVLWAATETWKEGQVRFVTIAQISEQIIYTLGTRQVHPDRKAIRQALDELEESGYIVTERRDAKGPGQAPSYKVVRRSAEDPLTLGSAPFHVWAEPTEEPTSALAKKPTRKFPKKPDEVWEFDDDAPWIARLEPFPDPLEWAERHLWPEHETPEPDGARWAGAVVPPPRRRAIRGVCPAPGVAVIYVLYGDTGCTLPVYLGSTGNLRGRLRGHVKDGKESVGWKARRCLDRRDAYLIERALLQEPTLLPLNERRR